MKQCIGIRVDANEKIGMGHLIRCRTIALELAECGCRVVFFTAENACEKLLEQWGLERQLLKEPSFSVGEEVPALRNLLRAEKINLLLVDSYQVTSEYVKLLREEVPVYLMDDLGEQAFPTQGIINYNLYASDLPYAKLYEDVSDKPKFLLGSAFAPVRKEFLQVTGKHGRSGQGPKAEIEKPKAELEKLKADPEQTADRRKHIMITMGGSDPMEITLKLAQCIREKWKTSEYVLDLVCGPMCAGRNKLEEFVESSNKSDGKGQVRLHTNVQDMWNLMADMDLVLCAAGSTMYELCTVGVPTVTCYYVDNQKKAAIAFGEKTSVLNAGDYREAPLEVIDAMIRQAEQLLEDEVLCQETIRTMRELVDGNGTRRIAEALKDACR